jgi:hypothetical protein
VGDLYGCWSGRWRDVGLVRVRKWIFSERLRSAHCLLELHGLSIDWPVKRPYRCGRWRFNRLCNSFAATLAQIRAILSLTNPPLHMVVHPASELYRNSISRRARFGDRHPNGQSPRTIRAARLCCPRRLQRVPRSHLDSLKRAISAQPPRSVEFVSALSDSLGSRSPLPEASADVWRCSPASPHGPITSAGRFCPFGPVGIPLLAASPRAPLFGAALHDKQMVVPTRRPRSTPRC